MGSLVGDKLYMKKPDWKTGDLTKKTSPLNLYSLRRSAVPSFVDKYAGAAKEICKEMQASKPSLSGTEAAFIAPANTFANAQAYHTNKRKMGNEQANKRKAAKNFMT